MGQPQATAAAQSTRPGENALRRDYTAVRSYTERLAAPLSPEDQTPQSMPDASPTKWHRAHTAWFFETFVLDVFAEGYRGFDPSYRHLFNSYYNQVGTQFTRAKRGLVTRPGVEEIARYRAHVDSAMMALLEGPISQELRQRVVLGLHHEQQHQELLLTDIKHLLFQTGLDAAYTPPGAQVPEVPHGPTEFQVIPEGFSTLGATGAGFHFDNEGPAHKVWLPAYAIADRLVSVGEVVAFIEDGGYQRPDLWLDEGLRWCRERDLGAPLYWCKTRGEGYSIFTLHGLRSLRASDPAVHLSYFEADAIARWCDARLPTEAEWERAAPDASGHLDDLPPPSLHPTATEAEDYYGAVWQWTRSDYAPYPGFRPAGGAIGEYNGKFMCGQYVLRGSSAITAPSHARRTYRNFFPPGAQWQFSGLRLARDV